MKPKTIQEIVETAGGYIELSYEIGITNFGIRNWFSRGIPRRYWKLISAKTGLTFDEIKRVNRKAVESARANISK